jgi:hypothetical protein
MSSYDCTRTSLEDRHHRSVFRNFFAAALTVVLSGFGAEIFAQPIKVGYAALVAGQVAVWMAKDGGYLSRHGIEADGPDASV